MTKKRCFKYIKLYLFSLRRFSFTRCGLSKPVNLPGVYEFTAMGLLDDTQIDYYNSKEQKKIPKQTWMKEKLQEDYWEKRKCYTQNRKSYCQNTVLSQTFQFVFVSDLHALQRRTGCEVDKQASESQWVTPVDAALPTKRKWNNVPILNQYTKGYLEKECVDWLKKFRAYADKEPREEIDLVMIAAVTGAVLVLLLTIAGLVLYILKKKGIIGEYSD
uniref:MHC class I-like antigen recognition-like domain-containing protein n=1 Tax=Cyprinus carpio TaxID=7962 RepID=A0A8C1NBQ0_CYPCA